jgi:hypothetical protein
MTGGTGWGSNGVGGNPDPQVEGYSYVNLVVQSKVGEPIDVTVATRHGADTFLPTLRRVAAQAGPKMPTTQ